MTDSVPPAAPAPLEPPFSIVNLARCISPNGFNHELHSWSIAEWTNAAAGEMGEACNLAKKLLRHRDGVAGNKKAEDKDVASLRQRCAEELADVVIYADLAMQALGYDLNDTVRRVFNRKSEELNAPYRVTEGPLGALSEAPHEETPT
jgi:NTP pyrophosphatase (non-canonical NTP hydrolase)